MRESAEEVSRNLQIARHNAASLKELLLLRSGKFLYLSLPAVVVEVVVVLIDFLYSVKPVVVKLKFFELAPGVFIADTLSWRHLAGQLEVVKVLDEPLEPCEVRLCGRVFFFQTQDEVNFAAFENHLLDLSDPLVYHWVVVFVILLLVL